MKSDKNLVSSKVGKNTHISSYSEKEEELLNKLLKSEAKVTKLEKENKYIERERRITEKNYKTITNSKPWRVSLPLRKSLSASKQGLSSARKLLFGKKYDELSKQHHELKQEKVKLKKQLSIAKERIKVKETEIKDLRKQNDEMNLRLHEADVKKLKYSANEAMESGNILSFLAMLIEHKNQFQAHYREVICYAAKLYINEDDDLKEVVYRKAIQGLKTEEVPEFIVRFQEASGKDILNAIPSYQGSLTTRSILRSKGIILPEAALDNKINAYRFVDQLGMRRPLIKENIYCFSQIPQEEATVIKPVDGAGARGVYLIFSKNKIYDVKRNQMLDSWQELDLFIKSDLNNGLVAKDEWLVEELILEDKDKDIPACDLKFYCFYGKVALILEIQRYPKVKYCWWDAHGRKLQIGKYDEQLFDGNGINEEEINIVESMSKEIPTPFIRIDFLKSETGLVFGEFTPKPGHYDEFNRDVDRWLGDVYLQAEVRLIRDLLEGKPFKNYLTMNGSDNGKSRRK